MNGEHKYVDINDVVLDKDNPRIRKYIEMHGDNPTPEQIHLALGVGSEGLEGTSGTTFQSLRESIRVNGGIIHPIIINKDSNNILTVIEGNTRLAIYKEFIQNGVQGKWEIIPAIIYDQLDQESIDAIRLQSHLVGPRAWDPYSKAKYLSFLHTHENMPFDRLVDYCGGRKKEVENYISAYNDMENHYRPILDSDADFDTTRFSGFVELQRLKVKEAIFDAGYTLEDFSAWIRDNLIPRLEHTRQLPKILKDDLAREVFLKKGAREALKLLDRGDLSQSLKDASLTELCKALKSKISELAWQDAEKLKDNQESEHSQAILDVYDELGGLVEFIGVNEE